MITISDRAKGIPPVAARPHIRRSVFTAGPHRWVVAYFDTRDRAYVRIDDASRRVTQVQLNPDTSRHFIFYGYATDWRRVLFAFMFASSLLFAALLIDTRRVWSLPNVDVLAMLGLMVPLAAMTLGRQDVAVYLVYPPLLYLAARLLAIGLGRAAAPGRLSPRLSTRTLGLALLGLIALRVAMNLSFSFVTDEGFGGVFGANSIHHGWQLYNNDTNTLDVYGPVTYLAYLPFELVFPMDPNWQRDWLPAAHAASIAFDLATLGALYVLGRGIGRGSRRAGLVLALAWALFPYTLFVLAENDNDALVAACCAWALVGLRRPAVRGALVGLAAAAKFAPLAIVPVIASGRTGGANRNSWMATLTAGLVGFVALTAYLPDGGIREFLDTTVLAAWGSPSPFTLWAHVAVLDPLRYVILAGTAILSGALFFIPRRRTLVQVAALSAAVLIALQLTRQHWLYPYTLWFAPGALVALFGSRLSPASAVGDHERLGAHALLSGKADV